MGLIYQLGIRTYLFLAYVVAPFNEKARLWYRGQKSVFPYLKDALKKGGAPVIWVHCASLGEFEQGRPLIEGIKKQHPHYRVLLTFFSPSGYEIRKDYDQADYVCYLPADTKDNAKRFIELVRPEKAFFIKYEFWKNYISELNKSGIPLYLVSSIFRPNQLFFKSGIRANWYKNVLSGVECFFVQNQESADLLGSIGFDNSMVTGDTRFDRVAEIAAKGKDLPLIEQFKGDSKLVVVGSSWQPDEEILIEYLKRNTSIKMIFAPHEVRETNINRLQAMLPEKAARLTSLEGNIQDYRILVIDSIGILASVYRYADVVYIGGGFGVGIHNTLEAAIFNTPILFGPKYLKFQEAVELVNRKLAFPVIDVNELTIHLDQLIGNDEKMNEIELGCRQFMRENVGATALILENVFK